MTLAGTRVYVRDGAHVYAYARVCVCARMYAPVRICMHMYT